MSIEVTCPGCIGDGSLEFYHDRTLHKCDMPNCECCGLGNGSRTPGWLADFHKENVKP